VCVMEGMGLPSTSGCRPAMMPRPTSSDLPHMTTRIGSWSTMLFVLMRKMGEYLCAGGVKLSCCISRRLGGENRHVILE